MTEEKKADEKIENTSEEKDVVTIEGAPPLEEEDTEWIKDLRKSQRETSRENKELKAKIVELTSTDKKSVELGPKPTLEKSDFDAEKYDLELNAWYEKKRLHEEQLAKVNSEKQKQDDEWKNKLASHEEKASSLNVDDFEDAQLLVQEKFNETQQGLIIQSSDNSAYVVYALGTNPKIAKELSSIKDHVKFIAAIAKLEAKLKVEKRKPVTEPEKKVTGSAPSVDGSDKQLDKLRKEAEETGDMTEVVAYKRAQKRKLAASQ